MEGVHISSSSEEGLSACDLIPLDECSLRQKWTEMAVILLQPEQLKNRGVNDLPQSQMGWIEMKISGLLAQCFVHQPWIPSLTCPLLSLLMCDTFPWIAWIAVPVYVCVCVRERERESFQSGGGCPVAQFCPTFCDPMDCSIPGFPVLHYLWDLFKLMSIESVMPSNRLMSVCPFSPQSFPASGSLPMSWLFLSVGKGLEL